MKKQYEELKTYLDNYNLEESFIMITVLAYRKCSTSLKALKWLDNSGVEYIERPIKEENPSYDELKKWYEISGLPLKKFFNTRNI